MGKISDEKLDWLIEGCRENKEYDCTDLSSAMQELKERREAEHVVDTSNMMSLDIKDQLRLVRDKCPELWQMVRRDIADCPGFFQLAGGECLAKNCKECWDKALEGEE